MKNTLKKKIEELGELTGRLARYNKRYNETLIESAVRFEAMKDAVGDGPFNFTKKAGAGIFGGIKYGEDVRLSTQPHHHGLWALFGIVHAPLVGMFRWLPREMGEAGFTLNINSAGHTISIPLHHIALEQRVAPSSIWGRFKVDPAANSEEVMIMEAGPLDQYNMRVTAGWSKDVSIRDGNGDRLEESRAQRILWGFFSSQGMNALRDRQDPTAEQKRTDRMFLGVDDMEAANNHLIKIIDYLGVAHHFDSAPLFNRLVEASQKQIDGFLPNLRLPMAEELFPLALTGFFEAHTKKKCYEELATQTRHYSHEGLYRMLGGFYKINPATNDVENLSPPPSWTDSLRITLFNRSGIEDDIHASLALAREAARKLKLKAQFYEGIDDTVPQGQPNNYQGAVQKLPRRSRRNYEKALRAASETHAREFFGGDVQILMDYAPGLYQNIIRNLSKRIDAIDEHAHMIDCSDVINFIDAKFNRPDAQPRAPEIFHDFAQIAEAVLSRPPEEKQIMEKRGIPFRYAKVCQRGLQWLAKNQGQILSALEGNSKQTVRNFYDYGMIANVQKAMGPRIAQLTL